MSKKRPTPDIAPQTEPPVADPSEPEVDAWTGNSVRIHPVLHQLLTQLVKEKTFRDLTVEADLAIYAHLKAADMPLPPFSELQGTRRKGRPPKKK